MHLPYGDQAFFIRSPLWNENTRYQDWPLMEDVEWWERMRRQYRMKILPWPVVTSARRFKKRGYAVSAFRNLATLMRYKLGASPDKLARQYNQ
jgi:hypothetical protein